MGQGTDSPQTDDRNDAGSRVVPAPSVEDMKREMEAIAEELVEYALSDTTEMRMPEKILVCRENKEKH